jgi:hypothetical protein
MNVMRKKGAIITLNIVKAHKLDIISCKKR